MAKWYIYENDEVEGPFEPDDLPERIDEDTLLCPAGSEDWKKASDYDELEPFLQSENSTTTTGDDPSVEESMDAETVEDVEIGDLKPTIDELKRLCEFATNEDLERERGHFWEAYDRTEKRVIRNQMVQRGIWPDPQAD